jgi:dihydrofolate reductase
MTATYTFDVFSGLDGYGAAGGATGRDPGEEHAGDEPEARLRQRTAPGRAIPLAPEPDKDATSTGRRIQMGRLVITEYISVDGVIEAPSGQEDFERVGWTDAFTRGPEGDQFKFDETMTSDAQLLGRITYETFATVWPHIEGEFADYFNAMPKYVVSSTLKDPEWNNTTVLGGDVIDEVTKLKQRYERDIVVHGSAQLAQTLMEHDLVEALHLLVYPVIVGAGKRLFDGTSETKRLELVETRTFGDGVHLLAYERAA